MYWYKSRAIFILIVAASALSACKPEIKQSRSSLKYFDLKGYFERDSARLTQLNKPVLKSVKHNGETETKTVRIANWGTELSLFKESDINRPAWKNSYSVLADSNLVIYKALEPDLKTKEILIKLKAGKVKYIMIINDTKNLLFKTQEKLSYFPDSLYLIQKAQTVRFLGANNYDIQGLFNQ